MPPVCAAGQPSQFHLTIRDAQRMQTQINLRAGPGVGAGVMVIQRDAEVVANAVQRP